MKIIKTNSFHWVFITQDYFRLSALKMQYNNLERRKPRVTESVVLPFSCRLSLCGPLVSIMLGSEVRRSLKTSILSLVLVHQLIPQPGLDRRSVKTAALTILQLDMSPAKDGKVVHACECVCVCECVHLWLKGVQRQFKPIGQVRELDWHVLALQVWKPGFKYSAAM